jgi:hypothetical protein
LAKAGRAFTEAWLEPVISDTAKATAMGEAATNPLAAFFETHTVGRGIVKWRHYFEIYDRHLRKFVDKETTLLEVGIYAGGSLDLWRDYLGADCDMYGVDVDPECKKFDEATVFIGDQADRNFWERFRAETPPFDIIIDDGGHTYEQQRVTLEELLPRLRPGGVYICEDVHGQRNGFLGYVYGLSRGLFNYELQLDESNPERPLSSPATAFQSAVHSVHLYPYVVVIERRPAPLEEFVATKRGTDWPTH